MFRELLNCSLLFAAALCIGSNAARGQNTGAPLPPGKLVDIGTHKLHLLCSGTGEPTVILESGLGGYSFEWGLVQPQISKLTRVCAYDRASYAWSENGPEPRGLRTSVNELHRLLTKENIQGPYVLVGQSWGGRIVRLFAHTYPQESAGMVLIDTYSEGTDKVPAELLDFDLREVKETDPAENLPIALRKFRTWAAAKKRQGDVTDPSVDPGTLMESTTASSKSPLGDRPLIMISAGRMSYGAEDRKEGVSLREKLRDHVNSQAFLATLSRNSRFIVARRSFHKVHLYEPDLVADAIRQVVASVRSGRRLDSKAKP